MKTWTCENCGKQLTSPNDIADINGTLYCTHCCSPIKTKNDKRKKAK